MTKSAVFLKTFFFWTPLITLIMSLFLRTSLENFLIDWLASIAIGNMVMTVCFLGTSLVAWTDRKVATLRGQQPPVRSGHLWLGVSLLWAPFGLYVTFSILGVWGPRLGLGEVTGGPQSYKSGILFTLIFAGLFFLLRAHRTEKENARKAKLQLKEVENERLQAELSALTAQMNPHLLFNTLNTVAALVPTAPDQAEELIVKLSELYRGVLGSSQKSLHTLEEELMICEAYLGIEKARFGERLNTVITIAPNIRPREVFIPALSLQPLVENAIKHGLSSRGAGGTVWVKVKEFSQAGRSTDRVQIIVEDDGVGLGNAVVSARNKGTGTGLKNCRARFKLQYQDRAEFQLTERPGGGTRILMTFPRSESACTAEVTL